MFICPHFEKNEDSIKIIFNKAAVKRAKEPNLFELTHTPIYFQDPDTFKEISEDELKREIFTNYSHGVEIYVIKGNTGTSKSEFCVILKKFLEGNDNKPLYLSKDLTYPEFLKTLVSYYEDTFSPPYPYKDNINALIDDLNIEVRQANLLWWLTDDVLVSKNAKISKGEEAEVRKNFIKILRKGIKRLLDPQGQGQSFSFITNDEFISNSSFLQTYFTNYKDFNKVFTASMYRKHKAPNIIDIIKEISTKTKSKNKRLYVIFEDFSLDENESRMIFNYIVADSVEGDYNTTFILAGTPKNLVHLDAEGTFRARRHLFETNYDVSSEREEHNYVPTFSHSDPVDFVEKYLGFIKTYEGSLEIFNNEYHLNKNSNFCDQCKKCENLEEIILFPFNKIFIKNLYQGSKFEKRKPRTLITLVGNLLKDYISGKSLFNSAYLKNINAPELLYEGENQKLADFTQWFGKDRSLFNKTFPDEIEEEDPFPAETDDPIIEEEGENILQIPDKLRELKKIFINLKQIQMILKSRIYGI